MVKDFKKIGSIPVVDAKNIDDLMRAYQLSRFINRADSKILATIRKTQGSRLNLVFIGEKAIMKKGKILEGSFKSTKFFTRLKTSMKYSVGKVNRGGASWSIKLKDTEGTIFKDYFKIKEDKNVFYLCSYRKGIELSKFVKEMQEGHLLFHELGHSVHRNLFTKKQLSEWNFLHKSFENKHITHRASISSEESFAEAFGARATGSYKLPLELRTFIEKFIE